ncbi:hypothetical protein EB796_011798 [Bugula neritina]|uniref:Uncharacterized protein n=1 Tax=Bugula neritina TaxID=10212 RepID=A0A7J7JU44_BUGNE|nr:hypothetical protein EB796_011798 [Bugula neritina]
MTMNKVGVVTMKVLCDSKVKLDHVMMTTIKEELPQLILPAGVVEERILENNNSNVKFFRAQTGSCYFTATEERCDVDDDQVILILSPPTKCGGTRRLAEQMTFGDDLSKYIQQNA